MKALILAGGLGTRLKSIVYDVPKPMAPIAGKPFLEHQIISLRENGIKNIVIAVSYMGDKIKSYFGGGKLWGVNITYSEEENPMGTAGAIKNAEKYLNDSFIVLNGDTYSNIDINKIIQHHRENNNLITISLKESKDCSRYGKVLIENGKITSFSEKENSGDGLISRGIYIFNKKVLNYIPENEVISLEKQILPKFVEKGLVGGYIDNSYFIDIGLGETYKEFKQYIIEKISIKKDSTVREALKKIKQNDLDIITVVDEEKKLIGVLNKTIIIDFFLEQGKVDSPIKEAMIEKPIVATENDDPKKIDNLLLLGINKLPILDVNGKLVDIKFRSERLDKSFPTIRGRAPLRVSFSGGGTDVPFYFEKHGGFVINTTINKYCHISMKKRADNKVIINSDMMEEQLQFDIKDFHYDGKLDLIKSILKLMEIDFGMELTIHNEIPPGRGLGSSASFSTLLISMLSEMKDLKYDNSKIAELAFRAETEELKIKGGWQDQFASLSGGFNFMEFNKDKKIVYPLRIRKEILNELNSRVALCYVGKSRNSGVIHKKQQQDFLENEEEHAKNLQLMKEIAIEIKDCLLSGELDTIGDLLHKSWINKKNVSSSISNEKINHLYDLGLKNGAIGGKLLGAGGGGYLLFYFKPEKKLFLKKALERWGAELIDFKFEHNGIEVWQVEKS